MKRLFIKRSDLFDVGYIEKDINFKQVLKEHVYKIGAHFICDTGYEYVVTNIKGNKFYLKALNTVEKLRAEEYLTKADIEDYFKHNWLGIEID